MTSRFLTDGVRDGDEVNVHGTDPLLKDTDGDGLPDPQEIALKADVPWFDLSAGGDVTPLFPDLDYACLTAPLAAPAVIRGTVFTNLTLDVNGLVYLNPAGYRNTAYSRNGGWDMEGYTVNAEALTVAPFWSDLVLVTNAAPASKILSGTASDGTNLYSVVEYRNMRRRQDRGSTNTLVTFQLAVPTGVTDRVFARYALASGNNDGRDASVGVQGVGGSPKDSWCFEQAGGVWPGLSLAFVIGTGSDPSKADTDDDGLTDLEEAALGTDPRKWDTDGDGLSDSDEADVHGTDPLSADTDNDGLSDYDELNVHFTDPFNPDTDGDSVTDGGEAAQGADPLDPDDVPSCEWFTLTGDLEQDAVKTLERTIRIPAGQSRLAVVALHSDEYPEYTGDSSQYNDILTWEVTPASGPPVSGSVDVNSRHAAWGDGIALNGFSPVCVEGFHALAAPAGAPMTVTVRLTAKNISDSILPSTVMVGVMGFDLDIDSDHDGDIDAEDEAAEETEGGIVAAGSAALAPLNIAFAPEGLTLGTLTLEAVSGGGKITLRSGNSTNSAAVTLPKTWGAGETVPPQLWVQGLEPSDAVRDIHLCLRYTAAGGQQVNDDVRLTVFKVEITPSTATVIEGADSGDFEAIVTPTGLSGLTYEWEWEAYAASGNTPSVTYTAPNAAKTQVARAHWYAFPDDRCAADTVCDYLLRCTVRIGDVACSSSARMSVQLVTPAARTEPKYEITGGATVAYDPTNQLWYVAGTGSLSRQVVFTTDWWLHANSEFTAKIQAHENQHRQDFLNGFDGHTFVTVPEFYARISSLVDPTSAGLVSKITAEYVQYMSDEEAELLSLVDGLEVRAYNVSDGVAPDYAYSNYGRFTYP